MIVYYYHSFSFADAITPELISRIVNKRRINKTRVSSINGYSERREAKPFLLSLGSIFHHAKDGDVIWGSGINPVWQKKLPNGFKVDIRAVRGPLTRYYVVEELGIECPKIYGDPILLFPKLFPEFKIKPKRDYVVILQHNDEDFVYKNLINFRHYNILFCQRHNYLPWFKVVEKILSSKFVISSSLHGLIFAEVYGIPARWLYNEGLPSAKTESRFKYNDYFASTGRSMNDFAKTIDEALEMGGKEPINSFDSRMLMKSFPYEFFRNWSEKLFSDYLRKYFSIRKFL